jgi:hypothetical protein
VDGSAVRNVLRSLAGRDSPDSVQGQLKKVVSQLKSGGQIDTPDGQANAPTTIDQALKQLQEMQSP